MKNKDGVEVKTGQLWMSLDKSRPMRVCEVVKAWDVFNDVDIKNVKTGAFTHVAEKNFHTRSKGWKFIGMVI